MSLRKASCKQQSFEIRPSNKEFRKNKKSRTFRPALYFMSERGRSDEQQAYCKLQSFE
jgi:hypothetical protein